MTPSRPGGGPDERRAGPPLPGRPAVRWGIGTPLVPVPACPPGATQSGPPTRMSGRETGKVWRRDSRRDHLQDTGRVPSRRFLRDAVVYDDYTIAEGMVIPQGAIRRRYRPETCPELPQKLARLARGDTAAVLAFVRTYGLLGYAQLAAAVGRGCRSAAAGDPLGWDLGAGRDGRVVSAPDVWAPGWGRCRAAAGLTGRAAPAAAADRQRPPADCPRRLGSAAGPPLLGVAVAQPRGLADVCARRTA